MIYVILFYVFIKKTTKWVVNNANLVCYHVSETNYHAKLMFLLSCEARPVRREPKHPHLIEG